MGKTRRKNGEGNGRSCDKDNPHNRGWRKRLDREYHKGNRTKLKGEVTGNIKIIELYLIKKALKL